MLLRQLTQHLERTLSKWRTFIILMENLRYLPEFVLITQCCHNNHMLKQNLYLKGKNNNVTFLHLYPFIGPLSLKK